MASWRQVALRCSDRKGRREALRGGARCSGGGEHGSNASEGEQTRAGAVPAALSPHAVSPHHPAHPWLEDLVDRYQRHMARDVFDRLVLLQRRVTSSTSPTSLLAGMVRRRAAATEDQWRVNVEALRGIFRIPRTFPAAGDERGDGRDGEGGGGGGGAAATDSLIDLCLTLCRDWGDNGGEGRRQTHDPVLAALTHAFSDAATDGQEKIERRRKGGGSRRDRPGPSRRRTRRVLVPGCGLGRLAVAIAALGATGGGGGGGGDNCGTGGGYGTGGSAAGYTVDVVAVDRSPMMVEAARAMYHWHTLSNMRSQLRGDTDTGHVRRHGRHGRHGRQVGEITEGNIGGNMGGDMGRDMGGDMGGEVICMGGMGEVRRDNRGGSLHEEEEVLPLCYRIYPFVHETSNLITDDVDRSCTIRPNGCFNGLMRGRRRGITDDVDRSCTIRPNGCPDTGNNDDNGDNDNDGEGDSNDGDSNGDGGDGDGGDDEHVGASSSHGTVTYHTSSLEDFLLPSAMPRAMPREMNGAVDGAVGGMMNGAVDGAVDGGAVGGVMNGAVGGVVDGLHGPFDAVVTCFFVDAAADLIDLVGSIHR